MLEKLSVDISECQMRAAQCRLRAEHAFEPNIKQAYLDMEQRWLSMARVYESAQRPSGITKQ
jgi:hypothetical protein